MTKQECLDAHSKYKAEGKSILHTDDPKVLAGAYLRYASGDIKVAIRAVETHLSGEWVDRPWFPGAQETLTLLQSLTDD